MFSILLTNPHQTFVKLFENWEQSETDKITFSTPDFEISTIIWFVQRDQRGFLHILSMSLHTGAGHGDDGPVESLK